MLFKSVVLLAAAAVASSQTTLTGQYSCLTEGAYELCQNLWGESEFFLPSSAGTTRGYDLMYYSA